MNLEMRIKKEKAYGKASQKLYDAHVLLMEAANAFSGVRGAGKDYDRLRGFAEKVWAISYAYGGDGCSTEEYQFQSSAGLLQFAVNKGPTLPAAPHVAAEVRK